MKLVLKLVVFVRVLLLKRETDYLYEYSQTSYAHLSSRGISGLEDGKIQPGL